MITSEDIEGARSAITYDDGQNVFLDGMKACPWCGEQTDESLRPYVQVGPTWAGGLVDARAVCPVCHVSTTRVTAAKVVSLASGEDVTRLAAIASARGLWNGRRG